MPRKCAKNRSEGVLGAADEVGVEAQRHLAGDREADRQLALERELVVVQHEPQPQQALTFFFSTEHADGEHRRALVDPRVPKDAPHRDLSDATLPFALALGVRRRHAPKSC